MIQSKRRRGGCAEGARRYQRRARVGASMFWGWRRFLIIAAIAGKQACGLGALGSNLNRVAIGIGMIPRGEVGLIFAGIGRTLTVDGQRILDEAAFSAILVMVMVTT